MPTLDHLKRSVESLSDEELKAFAAWLDELRWQRWDQRIVADSEEGKLDRLLEQARADISAGRTHPL